MQTSFDDYRPVTIVIYTSNVLKYREEQVGAMDGKVLSGKAEEFIR